MFSTLNVRTFLATVVLMLQLLFHSIHAFPAASSNPSKEITHETLVKRAYPALLDFDKNDPAAQERKKKALIGIADMLALVGIARAAQETNDHEIMDHYFHADNDAKNVADVFNNIWGKNEGGTGAEILRYVVISDKHGQDWCEEDKRRIAGLDQVNGTPGRAALILCPKAYKFPLLTEMKCDDFGDKASGKMSSFGGILLHELTHYNEIGKLATGAPIKDLKFSDKKDVYGPLGTRQYRDAPGSTPQSNADQYRWYAQEQYWTTVCKKTFTRATDNADYLKCTAPGLADHCILQ